MNPIVLALDFSSISEARSVARSVRPYVGAFKVGLELIWAEGPSVVGEIASEGLPVFVDAKLHDIPNTVGRAARQLGKLGATWVTVHATGGQAMMKAAVEGLGTISDGGGILAVTVLTSLSQDALQDVGIGGTVTARVTSLAQLAAASGVVGVVCSVAEVPSVKSASPGLLAVTPGIRSEGEAADDQARVSTVSAALRAGADLLVVGRAITGSPDPGAAARSIAEEVTLAS